jgi:hypothetical protein
MACRPRKRPLLSRSEKRLLLGILVTGVVRAMLSGAEAPKPNPHPDAIDVEARVVPTRKELPSPEAKPPP